MKFEIVSPILGFEDLKEVTLEKFDDRFMFMKSAKDGNVSFTLLDPFALKEYNFEIPDDMQKALEIKDGSNVLVLNVVLLQNPIENSVVNFAAPLVFNTDSNKAAQVVLDYADGYEVAEKISNYFSK